MRVRYYVFLSDEYIKTEIRGVQDCEISYALAEINCNLICENPT